MLTLQLICILIILVVHFVADFVLQSHWMAINKSKSWKALLTHTAIYSCIWIVIIPNWKFILITFISHTLIDAITSRINTKLWKEGKIHQFFVMIGFDQLLHYTQLFLTLYFLD